MGQYSLLVLLAYFNLTGTQLSIGFILVLLTNRNVALIFQLQ